MTNDSSSSSDDNKNEDIRREEKNRYINYIRVLYNLNQNTNDFIKSGLDYGIFTSEPNNLCFKKNGLQFNGTLLQNGQICDSSGYYFNNAVEWVENISV